MMTDFDFSLPPAESFTPRTATYYYGAADVAAKYCGLKRTPAYTFGVWQHGWVPAFFQVAAHSFVGQAFSADDWLWVADQASKQVCIDSGHKRVEAIGLPIIYVPEQHVEREPLSLLVMPVHSGLVGGYDWNEEEYVRDIERIAPRFHRVIICIHAGCWEKGYWVHSFGRRGFEVIRGAVAHDRNSLIRLVRNFSRFEYVTSNGIGSHIPYAAYLGAKVSVYGAYAHTPAALEADRQDQYYRDHPELAELSRERWSYEYTSRALEPFFRLPDEAADMRAWGCEQVGLNCKKSPAELVELFRWNWWNCAARGLLELLPTKLNRAARSQLRAWLARPQS